MTDAYRLGGPSGFSMLKPPRSRAAVLNLTREVTGVNDVLPDKTSETAEIWADFLYHIGKILPRARKPPIPQDKTDERKGGKVGKAGPVRA